MAITKITPLDQWVAGKKRHVLCDIFIGTLTQPEPLKASMVGLSQIDAMTFIGCYNVSDNADQFKTFMLGRPAGGDYSLRPGTAAGASEPGGANLSTLYYRVLFIGV